MIPEKLQTLLSLIESIDAEDAVDGKQQASWFTVLLLLPGMIVNGQIISQREYHQILNDAASDDAGIAVVSQFFPVNVTNETERWLLDPDTEPIAIHLKNVEVRVGGTFQFPIISIALDSILGWTFGTMRSPQP